MELPTNRQIDEAIADSRIARDSQAQLNERIDALCRLTDEELARMGIRSGNANRQPKPRLDDRDRRLPLAPGQDE